MKKGYGILGLTLAASLLLGSCKPAPNKQEPDPDTFARGADVSWLTEMEAAGRKFYDAEGRESECMELLRDLGMNALRLRVWVNPADGWCNTADLMVKARRAHKLGMRLMVDFHYSDSWADPGKQHKPTAWGDLSFEQLRDALARHTREVLQALRAEGIEPEWVQVGNETGNGMLWEDGKASVNMAGYARLSQAGYDAVKEIFPRSKVVVHIQEGDRKELFRWIFDGLRSHGARWDAIGMSLYPMRDNWRSKNEAMLDNIRDLRTRYATPVVICEIGMPVDHPDVARDFIADLMAKVRTLESGTCLGLFYWEPQCYGGWKGYGLGAFDHSGRPTPALDPFQN